jgi:hypothetical protein
VPRLAEEFEALVADWPNAVKRDRASATIRSYVGDKIVASDEVQGGVPGVAFRSARARWKLRASRPRGAPEGRRQKW